MPTTDRPRQILSGYHQFGQWINTNLFQHLGFILVKVNRPGSVAPEAKIGRYRLKAPLKSPLPNVYKQVPDVNSQIGRLACCVRTKYPNSYMIDVGANIGDTAAVARLHSDIPLVCVEGDPALFPFLLKNTASISDVLCFQIFLGERTESIVVQSVGDGWNMTLLPREKGGSGTRPLHLVSLDDFLAGQQHPKGPCKFLKIDAEGFDTRIIRGARTLLLEEHPVLLFEYNIPSMHDIQEDGWSIFSLLREQGYESILFYDSYGRFLLHEQMSDEDRIRNLHEYLRPDGSIYFDLCLFHKTDAALAAGFIAQERQRRIHKFARVGDDSSARASEPAELRNGLPCAGGGAFL